MRVIVFEDVIEFEIVTGTYNFNYKPLDRFRDILSLHNTIKSILIGLSDDRTKDIYEYFKNSNQIIEFEFKHKYEQEIKDLIENIIITTLQFAKNNKDLLLRKIQDSKIIKDKEPLKVYIDDKIVYFKYGRNINYELDLEDSTGLNYIDVNDLKYQIKLIIDRSDIFDKLYEELFKDNPRLEIEYIKNDLNWKSGILREEIGEKLQTMVINTSWY